MSFMISYAYYGHLDIVQYLVSQGADTRIDNEVLLHLASEGWAAV